MLQVQEFSKFDDAIFTLLRTILGDFDFHAIERADPFLGPLFFLAYVFFVFFVFLYLAFIAYRIVDMRHGTFCSTCTKQSSTSPNCLQLHTRQKLA